MLCTCRTALCIALQTRLLSDLTRAASCWGCCNRHDFSISPPLCSPKMVYRTPIYATTLLGTLLETGLVYRLQLKRDSGPRALYVGAFLTAAIKREQHKCQQWKTKIQRRVRLTKAMYTENASCGRECLLRLLLYEHKTRESRRGRRRNSLLKYKIDNIRVFLRTHYLNR